MIEMALQKVTNKFPLPLTLLWRHEAVNDNDMIDTTSFQKLGLYPMTIEKEHMIDPILLLCPSFVPIYQKFLTDWENDEETERDGLPYYIALGDLASHLIKLLKADDTRYFSKIFEVVEQWQVNGSHYVQEAAVIGLLEGLQNIASHDSKIDAEDFFVWLGPVSKSSWEKLNRFWNGEVGALKEN